MDLGDRMKQYEGQETERTFIPGLPVIVRLDGRAFHTFTRGLVKPFDYAFMALMEEVTKALVQETNAVIGYTQSDEISLVLWNSDPKVHPYFGGRIQKTVSVLASKATAEFNAHLSRQIPEKVGEMPLFDARAFVVPTLEEAANCLLWREQDATKNSISAAAQAHFPHKDLHGLHSNQLQERLWAEAGVNWNTYPTSAKRGSYWAKRTVEVPFSADDLNQLPPRHAARTDPNFKLTRTGVVQLDLPPLGSVANRVGVLFHGEQPVIRTT